jgi:hypothetical protein
METTNDYHKQAEAFVQETGITVSFQYVGHTSRHDSKRVPTAQFRVTITRDGRKPWAFDYSDSEHDSYEWADKYDKRGTSWRPNWGPKPQSLYGKVESSTKRPEDAERHAAITTGPVEWAGYLVRKRIPVPHAYDVLAGITKNDPGTFSDFCADYGYSDDSIKARDLFLAVVEEWQNIRRMFSEEEITKLQNIQ